MAARSSSVLISPGAKLGLWLSALAFASLRRGGSSCHLRSVNEESSSEAEVDDSMSGWGFWLIAIFLYALTVYASWLSWERHQLVDAASRFEEVLGRVEGSAIKERGGTGQVSARVAVGYTVQGQSYELQTNGLDGRLSNPAQSGSAAVDAEALVSRFPLGAPVAVFYDPRDPSVSALTRDIRGRRKLGSAAGTLFLSLGYTMWLWRRRRARR